MNYFDLMNDFIDGSLQADKEQELFIALSSSEELRYQMKQLVAVSSVTKNKQMMTEPSNAVTTSLFSAIGVENFYEEKTDDTGNTPKPVGFIGKYGQSIVSSIVSIAASFLLFMLVFGNDNNDFDNIKFSSNGNGINNVVVENSSDGSDLNSTTPAVVDQKSESPDIATIDDGENTEKVKTVIKYKYIYVNSNTDNERITDNTNMENNSEKNIASNKDIKETNSSKQNDELLTKNEPELANVTTEDNVVTQNEFTFYSPDELITSTNKELSYDSPVANGNTKNLTVEIRGNTDWMVDAPTVEPSEKATFINNSMTGLYRLGEISWLDGDIYLGGELRQENFFQKFRGFDNNGIKNIYEQQPNFTSIGGVFRYVNRSVSYVNPFAQVAVGGNKAGYLGRGMAGLLITPYDNINFVLGFEYSSLFYKHENGKYESGKFGFNYGVTFNF